MATLHLSWTSVAAVVEAEEVIVRLVQDAVEEGAEVKEIVRWACRHAEAAEGAAV